MSHREPTDEEVLERLLAPPKLDDGVEALDYWRCRRQQLPWYRIRARREAVRMMIRWEQRVGAAIVTQHRVPLQARVSAGMLVARSRAGRGIRRVGIAVLATATTVVVLLTVLAAAAVIFVLQAL